MDSDRLKLKLSQLKSAREIIEARIEDQVKLINKISRGKCIPGLQGKIVRAMAKHDLELLKSNKADIENELPQLRNESHSKLLTSNRQLEGDNN